MASGANEARALGRLSKSAKVFERTLRHPKRSPRPVAQAPKAPVSSIEMPRQPYEGVVSEQASAIMARGAEAARTTMDGLDSSSLALILTPLWLACCWCCCTLRRR